MLCGSQRRSRVREEERTFEARAVGRVRERNRGLRTTRNGEGGKRGGRRYRGWGQWRCPSEGHGRECGLRPSVQSGVQRCGVLFSRSRSLRLPALSDAGHPLRPPAASVCPFVRSSVRPFAAISLLLPLTRGPAARRRLQECTKCTALTDTRPRSTASTCLLRPFASPCPSSLSLSLSLLYGPSFLFSPVGYSASAGHSRILYIVLPPPPLPGTDRFSTTGVVARLFSSTPSWWYIRPNTHARTHARNACGPVRRRGTLCRRCRGYIPGRPSGDTFSLRAFSRPPAALSLSLFPPRGKPSPLAFFAVSFDRASFYAPVPG